MPPRSSFDCFLFPEAVRTQLGIFPDIDSACTAVSSIIGQGVVPAAMEMIDSVSIRAILNVAKDVFPADAGAVLLVEVEGVEEEVDELSSRIEASMFDTGATDVKTAVDAKERERLWHARKGAFGALGALAPNYYLVDAVVPRTRLAEMLSEVGNIAVKHDLLVANVFHAGDGNLHPCIAFDERKPGTLERVMQAGGEMLENLRRNGRHIVGGTWRRLGKEGVHATGLQR